MLQVQDMMTSNPACCLPEADLREVAQLMVEHDCGEIPVVDKNSRKPVGVITDRDIVCRTIAEGKNPLEQKAADCMTSQVITVKPETSIDECCSLMEDNQIRRVPVVDDKGACCGMISQADIALKGFREDTAELVQDVSRPAR